MAKLALIIRTRTQPGKRAKVRQLWETHLRQRVVENPAQELYLFCEDDQDPDTFYLVELYTERAALAANADSAWFAAYLQAVGPLLRGQAEVGMATPVWAKGIAL